LEDEEEEKKKKKEREQKKEESEKKVGGRGEKTRQSEIRPNQSFFVCPTVFVSLSEWLFSTEFCHGQLSYCCGFFYAR